MNLLDRLLGRSRKEDRDAEHAGHGGDAERPEQAPQQGQGHAEHAGHEHEGHGHEEHGHEGHRH